PSGRRCFPIYACARRCWIESRTERTSSKPAPSRIAFAEPWRCGRKRKHRSGRRSSFYIAGAKEGAQTPPLPLHSIPAGTVRLLSNRSGILINEVGPIVSIKVGPNQVVKRTGQPGKCDGVYKPRDQKKLAKGLNPEFVEWLRKYGTFVGAPKGKGAAGPARKFHPTFELDD